MKILVFNAGSSSLKFKLFEAPDAVPSANAEVGTTLVSGVVERLGTSDAALTLVAEASGVEVGRELGKVSHAEALDEVLNELVEGKAACLSSLDEVDAIGHRIAHTGAEFTCSAPIDDHVVSVIEQYADLAPLHNPAALDVIRSCQERFGDTLEVAGFDTAFHQTIPPRNYIYPIPYHYYEEHGVRRFGFHGLSHKNVSRRAAEFLGTSPRELKMITCHLGAGVSLAAIDHGISMDTTMGYTPLDGVMMGTRSGSVDPAIVTTLMDVEDLSPSQMDTILNRESGLLGVSGVSGDLRELEEVIAHGDAQAELAYDIFLNSIRRMIGAYCFELAGLDCIVCTAGVGENDPYARRLIFRGLEPFGIQIDHDLNRDQVGQDLYRISTDASEVTVLVVHTNEEAEIARDILFISNGVDISDPWSVE